VLDLRARPLLVAPDSFKGTLSAPAVAAAIARGAREAGLPVDEMPIADGGEGTLEVLVGDGERLRVPTSDPLGRPIEAEVGLLGELAVVEVAAASGLELVAADERDAWAADSYGTGELIAAAIASGARRVLVAAGGSATTDGGAGAIAAIERAGGPQGAELVVLCDVRVPFELAAERYGPQKGADRALVPRQPRRLERVAAELPRDPRGVPGGGAAGGLAGGLWAAFGARLEPGAPFVLSALGAEQRLRAARAVVVGEGRLDRTTLDGKAPAEVAVRARQMGVPAHAVVGVNALDRFDARILDLQLIIEAGDELALERAGARIAAAHM
jgi:glycerate kinase